jgi:hypothetical protein
LVTEEVVSVVEAAGVLELVEVMMVFGAVEVDGV